jgi:hypothetical protein
LAPAIADNGILTENRKKTDRLGIHQKRSGGRPTCPAEAQSFEYKKAEIKYISSTHLIYTVTVN